VKVINIEANATLDIGRSQILPAVISYQRRVAEALTNTKMAGVSVPPTQKALLQQIVKGAVDLSNALDALDKTLVKANGTETKKLGEMSRDLLIPAMQKVRNIADNLEGVVEDDLWPLPKYREMLFQY
jgi:glutamine synthetase